MEHSSYLHTYTQTHEHTYTQQLQLSRELKPSVKSCTAKMRTSFSYGIEELWYDETMQDGIKYICSPKALSILPYTPTIIKDYSYVA